MRDDRNMANRDGELERILSELNSGMQKDRQPSGENRTVQAEPSAAAAASATESEEAPPRKPNSAPLGRRRKREQNGEETAAGRSEEKSAFGDGLDVFLQNTTVVEETPSEQRSRNPAVRHIAVTAAEVVEIPSKREKERTPSTDEPSPTAGTRARYKRPRMTRRERLTALVGLVVSVFFLVGVVCTVIGGVDLAYNIVNSTALKEELAKFIFPLVIVDTPEFEDPKSLDNSVIISSAIWAFIIDDNDKSKYPTDEFGEMTVPDVDIEPYIRKLYGGEIEIVHQTVDGGSVQMYYDAENKCYLIESTPSFLPYTPRVEKISRSGEIYTLHVSYVLPDVVWELDPSHKNARVDKELEYRLQKEGDGYRILSVKLLALTGMDMPSLESFPESDALLELESAAESEEGEDLLSELASEESGSSASGTDESVSGGDSAESLDTDSSGSAES